ncbi:MAG: hypothetical protein HRJ53_15285 [Acidobacteria bacterium Pan2503]|uniref:Uncharacterized protein n=1 Tax=Candidatus Acidiferrum panamense TaxID=2741543 RepID=A0A7V8NRU7_9BACT|nr:hypothetical protein [Candidatus Acidoferrum panamensis]
MDRRELIKALLPIPLVPEFINAQPVTVAEIKPGNYMLFFDPQVIDVDQLVLGMPFPHCMLQFVPVKLRQGQTIDDAVKLYKLDEAPCSTSNP